MSSSCRFPWMSVEYWKHRDQVYWVCRLQSCGWSKWYHHSLSLDQKDNWKSKLVLGLLWVYFQNWLWICYKIWNSRKCYILVPLKTFRRNSRIHPFPNIWANWNGICWIMPSLYGWSLKVGVQRWRSRLVLWSWRHTS